MFKYQFKSGKYFAGLIKSAELFLKSRFEGLGEFGLYALRTSYRLVCSATNHHRSQRKNRSSGVFYRFAPAWVQVPKIYTIKKNLRIRRFFLWCRLRDLNPRPTDYKSSKLLIPHNINLLFLNKKSLAGKGFKQFFKILNTFKLRVGIASCMYFTHSALTQIKVF